MHQRNNAKILMLVHQFAHNAWEMLFNLRMEIAYYSMEVLCVEI